MIPERAAERILREHAISRHPVPVDRLARQMGLRLAFEPFEGDLSGMLYRDDGEGSPVIVVNSLNPKVRQRFTIAHELGHFVLHDDLLFIDKPVAVRFRDARSSLATNPEEIEANRFAASLLLPKAWVVAEADRRLARSPDIASEALVDELARTFDVSRQAMELRLSGLGAWGPH